MKLLKNLLKIIIYLLALLGLFTIVVGIKACYSMKPMVKKLHDGSVRGNLGALRSALSIYVGDHNGQFPQSLDELIPNYLPGPSTLWSKRIHEHPPTSDHIVLKEKVIGDSGKWAYVYNPSSKDHGELYIDCTHLDYEGKRWHEQ